MRNIFISHSHIDKPIVDALSTLISSLFGREYVISYSSRSEGEGAIGYGEEWYKWIQKQIEHTELAFIILTPSSVQKPWVLWEAGALAGALLNSRENSKKIIPISFGLSNGDIPSPFAGTQVANGADAKSIDKMIEDCLFPPLENVLNHAVLRDIARKAGVHIDTYISSIHNALLQLPHAVTEATVQEWIDRLDNLKKENRSSEAGVYENWLDLAFGREKEDEKRPIDVRIHRRLGDMYAASGSPKDAQRQFQMARKLAPRDVFILRSLAKAYLDDREYGEVKKLIDQINAYDVSAFTKNPENAAFKSKYYLKQNDFKNAENTLKYAIEYNAKSYYLLDILGQLYIKSGEISKSEEVYRRIIMVMDDLNEVNVWVCATRMTAAMVTKNFTLFISSLNKLMGFPPSREEFNTIDRGIRELAGKIKWDLSEYEKIVQEQRF
jgi:tetratricopeptide (TPR) repeat protein